MINSEGDDGAMYVFYDPKQNLFVEQTGSLPALGEPFTLPVNCRNTRSIAYLCSEILDVQIPTKDDAPIGDKPEIVTLDLDYDIKKRVERYVHDWINKGKLKPKQVAILSPNKLNNTSLKGMTKVKGVSLTDDIQVWKDNQAILFSTVRGFKGLEADAIILVDVPSDGESFNFKQSDYYVACSRAKHLLVVIRKED
jgi:DNA helicase IV